MSGWNDCTVMFMVKRSAAEIDQTDIGGFDFAYFSALWGMHAKSENGVKSVREKCQPWLAVAISRRALPFYGYMLC